MGTQYIVYVRVISKKALKQFYEQHPDAKDPLSAWYYEAKHANWTSPAEVKEQFRNASIIGNNRVAFNIKGNDYRLIVKFHYNTQIIYIRFVGTHREYDGINAEEI